MFWAVFSPKKKQFCKASNFAASVSKKSGIYLFVHFSNNLTTFDKDWQWFFSSFTLRVSQVIWSDTDFCNLFCQQGPWQPRNWAPTRTCSSPSTSCASRAAPCSRVVKIRFFSKTLFSYRYTFFNEFSFSIPGVVVGVLPQAGSRSHKECVLGLD